MFPLPVVYWVDRFFAFADPRIPAVGLMRATGFFRVARQAAQRIAGPPRQ